MWDEKGTTLIEVVMVITIMLFIGSIILLSYGGSAERLDFEQFKDQLQRDINWGLQYADLHQQIVYILFLNDNFTYIVQVSDQIQVKRAYNKKFRITDNLNQHRLMIQANGTVSNFGHLNIYVESKLFAKLNIEMFTGVVREEIY